MTPALVSALDAAGFTALAAWAWHLHNGWMRPARTWLMWTAMLFLASAIIGGDDPGQAGFAALTLAAEWDWWRHLDDRESWLDDRT